MTTKTLTIREEAYEALASEKKPGESFSELIMRTYKKKGDISRFIGAWSDMGDETADELHKHIIEIRKRSGKQRRKELMGHLK